MADRQIVCATDLSPASLPAWEEAQLLAGLLGARLVLLHVVAPVSIPVEGYFPPALYGELMDSTRADATREIERLVAGQIDPKLAVTVRVEDGSAASRIADIAGETPTDLIVMGTHGRTGFNRALWGSVADRVVRTAPCPVVTVPARVAVGGGRRLARILYPTDFSPPARAAWSWVATLAQAAGAEVDLIHVTPAPVPDRHLAPDLVDRMAQILQQQGEAEAERFLQRVTFPRDRVHVHIATGIVGEQIVHLARARSAGLIVMGTHGWSGLVRWMLGSVAQHAIQAAPCPVLTVGPKGHG